VPEPNSGNFCGTGRLGWIIQIIIVVILVALFIWKLPAIMTTLGVTGRAINDMPQAIENMKEQQRTDWRELQALTNSCNCTKTNLSKCFEASGSISEYAVCQAQQCPDCFMRIDYARIEM
jgi:Sec-independent protein translocase protein TatA